jgi:hypothetical protein
VFMRRLAILFALLAALSTIEHIVLPGKLHKVVEAPGRIRRALVSLAGWRAVLIGPLRLLQRAASPGAGPWLGQSN